MEPLLTPDEHKALALSGELAGLLAGIVGDSRSRAGDINEFVDHIHAIQHAVMAQAAARAYPDLYRRLGEMLPGQ